MLERCWCALARNGFGLGRIKPSIIYSIAGQIGHKLQKVIAVCAEVGGPGRRQSGQLSLSTRMLVQLSWQHFGDTLKHPLHLVAPVEIPRSTPGPGPGVNNMWCSPTGCAPRMFLVNYRLPPFLPPEVPSNPSPMLPCLLSNRVPFVFWSTAAWQNPPRRFGENRAYCETCNYEREISEALTEALIQAC